MVIKLFDKKEDIAGAFSHGPVNFLYFLCYIYFLYLMRMIDKIRLPIALVSHCNVFFMVYIMVFLSFIIFSNCT